MIGFGYESAAREAPLYDSINYVLHKLPADGSVLFALINRNRADGDNR
jgi:hypothetical protein